MRARCAVPRVVEGVSGMCFRAIFNGTIRRKPGICASAHEHTHEHSRGREHRHVSHSDDCERQFDLTPHSALVPYVREAAASSPARPRDGRNAPVHRRAGRSQPGSWHQIVARSAFPVPVDAQTLGMLLLASAATHCMLRRRPMCLLRRRRCLQQTRSTRAPRTSTTRAWSSGWLSVQLGIGVDRRAALLA